MNVNIPLVTVIIPCYNHEKYVTDAIKNVIDQTYKNIELIVIDDGSQDNSVDVIQKLADTYKFIFIHRENRGLNKTLNEAIAIAKGKYFCSCASDDMYIKDKIEKQVQYMEANPQYGLAFGNVIQFDDNGHQEKIVLGKPKSGWLFEDIITGSIILPAVTVMQKIKIIKELGGYDENLWIDDVDLWLRVADKYEIGYMNDYLAYYRRHQSNISSNALKMYKAQKAILKKWRHKKNHDKHMSLIKLYWFDILSVKHKKEAKIYIIPGIKNMFTITYLKAIIKYFFYK